MLAEITPLAAGAEIAYRQDRPRADHRDRPARRRRGAARRARGRRRHALRGRRRADRRARATVVAEMTVAAGTSSARHDRRPRVWVAEPAEAETVARLLVAFRNHLGVDWPSRQRVPGRRRAADRDARRRVPARRARRRLAAGRRRAAALPLRHLVGGRGRLLEDLFVRGTRARHRPGPRAARARRRRGAASAAAGAWSSTSTRTTTPRSALYHSLGFDNHDDRYGGGNLFMRLGLEAAAMTSTRWPPGERTKQRGAPQCSPAARARSPRAAQALERLRRSRGATTATWPCGGRRRVVGEQQVDLGPSRSHPARAPAQRLRRRDLGEAQQARRTPPPRRGRRRGLERDVVQAHAMLAQVVVEDLQRRAGASGAPWPGTTSRAARQGAQALERGAVARRLAVDHRDLDRARGSRRRRAPRPTGTRSPCRRRCALGRVQLELALAEVELARHRQRLDLAERAAARALRRSARRRSRAARAAPRRARRAAARRSSPRTPSAASGKASRPSRWSQSPWVASRPASAEARLLEQRRQQLELVGEHRRVDDERLVAACGRRVHGRLPDADVTTTTSGCSATTRTAAPRARGAWPPRGGS